MGKLIQLKEYSKTKHGSLEGKIVVGSDIRPAQAINLAMQNQSLQVVTDKFDQQVMLKIQEDKGSFVKDPSQFLLNTNSKNFFCFRQKFFMQTQKNNFLHQVETFLNKGQFRKVREDIFLIADELFTNFAKSATEETRSMQFGIESDEERVLVYCKDSFGSLDPKVMLRNIQDCYKKGVKESINLHSKGGAGIGSYLMYHVSEGLGIVVTPGRETMVLAWMPKKMHHGERVDLNKNLIVIESQGE